MALSTIQNNSFADTAVHGRRNLIINGAMQVAQRGTSISPATGAYSFSLDRWKSYSGSSYTISQQEFSAGQTDVPNIKNYMRIANGASTTSLHQLIEDVTTVSGTSVTLSFYIKGSSAYTLEIGAYQNFGSGGSATVNTANLATVSVTTSWTRVTATFTVPSISGKTVGTSSYLRIDIGTGTYYIPASNTTEITGVQLELGSQATPFEHRSFGEELSLCERYYQILSPLAGHGNSTTFYNALSFNTAMRTQPTLSCASNTMDYTDGYASNYNSTNANPTWVSYIAHNGGRFSTSNHASVTGDARRGTMMLNSAISIKADAEL